MLVIRLARVGRKNQASFRVVAAEKARTPTGKFVAQLGHYNPHSKEFAVDNDKLQTYFKNGAQPSSAVVKLLKRNKISMPKWAEDNLIVKKKAPKVKKKVGEDEAPKAAPAEGEEPAAAPAEATEEASKEEPTPETKGKAEKPAKEEPAESAPKEEPKAEAKPLKEKPQA